MGVLPDDPAVPADQRFSIGGEASMLSLGATSLRVIDASKPLSVYIQKTDITPIDAADDWELQIELQMHSAARDTVVKIGNQITVTDTAKTFGFGVATNEIGFVDIPSSQWVAGLTFAMDTTSQQNQYRVVKTGSMIDVFVNGGASAVLSIPVSAFPDAPQSSRIAIVGTSIIGTADFEVASYTFRYDTGALSLSACPPLVSAGDTLRLESGSAVPGSPNALYVVAVNGAPFTQPLLYASANGQGEWALHAVVPAGLSGLELTFLQFGFSQGTGMLAASNTASVAF